MSTSASKRQSINPPAYQPISDLYHLSQAVRVGNMIWLSGQTGVDATMTPAKGVEAQSRLAFQHVKTLLEAAGATMADIVELTIYHTDIGAEVEQFLKVKDEFIPAPYPAVTGIRVAGLALPDLLLELRIVAVVGSG